ncbi:hypothetical protein NUW54_g11876 [Trametes sanguinea]|uniref:Uncharacterized protein n=1 Tax=Trametes sanguinea TaxID=158606 RepID=A0ACC1N5I8_9APHY|nr:hypothetical protein NUW54_g11876 [Trametes sanguinea]
MPILARVPTLLPTITRAAQHDVLCHLIHARPGFAVIRRGCQYCHGGFSAVSGAGRASGISAGGVLDGARGRSGRGRKCRSNVPRFF